MSDAGTRIDDAVGQNGDRYSVRAVDRVADILDALQTSQRGASLATLAAATQMPKSSVFRYLSTLEARGYVVKSPQTGDYTLGLALPSQQRYFELLADRLRPVLEQLRDRFGETINLGVLDGEHVTYLAIIESRRTMRLAARAGDRDYLHSTAVGKAIAATLDLDEVRRLLPAAGLPARTPRTIVDVDEYLHALERIRADGYAIDDEENEEGARCAAVALDGLHVPAAVSVSAPAVRLSREQAAKIGAVLARDAPRISRSALVG